MILRFFESQRKNKTPKDWVTTISNDIKELNLNLKIEDIKEMKRKHVFMNTVKRKIRHKTLKYLETMKEKHSKTKKLKHPVLKMQKYLMPSEEKITQEDSIQIFKKRSRMTAIKLNHKNKYETYECDACKIEDESQEHVMKCEEIKKIQKYDENEVPEYEKIMTGNLRDQIKIAKSFSEKLKILDIIKKKS